MGITRILFILALIYLGYRAVTIAGRLIFRLGRATGRNERQPERTDSDRPGRVDASRASDADFEDIDPSK